MSEGSSNKRPMLGELDFSSVKSTADLLHQANLLSKIADVKIDEYMLAAPEIVQKIHDRGVPKQVIVGLSGGTITLIAAVIGLLYGARILSVFVSVLQPLYYTYKALETPGQDDDTVWLTYWMVHGVLYMAEHSIFLPVVHLLPGLYFVAKMIVQIWMVNFEGSTVIYQRFLAPIFRKHESQLDQGINMAKKEAMVIAGLAKLPKAAVEEELEKERDSHQRATENNLKQHEDFYHVGGKLVPMPRFEGDDEDDI